MNSQPQQQEKSPTTTPAHPQKKCLKFQKPNIINFIANHRTPSKLETNQLNRKRVIQNLDLFNSKYDCKTCRKKLRYKADQIIHLKLKHKNATTEINCPECHIQFKTYHALTTHLMTIHLNERPYGCKICHKKFHAFALLKRHCHKKHLNQETPKPLPPSSSLLSPVSLNSSNHSKDSKISNSKVSNNFYDLIDYENSILIKHNHNNSIFVPASNNPLSVNSTLNMKFFAYINKIPKSMDLEPIIAYLDEEKNTAKQIKFTIKVQLAPIRCNQCIQNFQSNSEYLSHVWKRHLNNGKNTCTNTCWSCSTSTNYFKKASFKTDDQLMAHIQEQHLFEETIKRYKCNICHVGFNSLEAAKSHYLMNHNSNPKDNNYKFAYSCSRCDEIFSTYSEISKHSEDCSASQACNPIRCVMCKLEFSNKVVFNFHLSQHKYAEWVNRQIDVEYQMKAANNIKNSNNNKQYSIDAIVNSPVKNFAKKIKLEDIASKISIKQQQTNSAFQNFQTALASLIQLSDKPEFNMQNSSIFGTNFSTLASNYNKLLNNDKNTSNTNNHHQHQMFNMNQPIMSSLINNTNSKMSAFAIPSFEPDNKTNTMANSQHSGLVNPFLHNYNKQQHLHMNNMTNPNNGFTSNSNNKPTFNSSFKHYISNSDPNLNKNSNNNSNFNPNKKLTIQTASSSCKSETKQPLDFKCEFCGYAFKSMSDLIEHRAMHVSQNQKRPLRCHLCAIKFAKSEQLMKHMIVHKANGTDSICKLCFATFGRRQDLDRHMLFHSK